MANPFGSDTMDTMDYGTVSGQGRGFRSAQKLRTEETKIGTPSDTEEFRGRLQQLLRKTLGKVQSAKTLFSQLNDMAQQSNDDIAHAFSKRDRDTEEDRRALLQDAWRGRFSSNKLKGAPSPAHPPILTGNHSKVESKRGQAFAVKSLKQTLTSAVEEFQEASQDVWRELENAGDPFRAKTKSRSSAEHFSMELEIAGNPFTAKTKSCSSAEHFSDAAEMSDEHDRVRLVKEERRRQERQQQQQQMLVVSDEAAHLEERAIRMGKIEEDIVTLNDIMGQIGELVMDQGEQIDHIETNVEHAYDEVTQGNKQLEKGVQLKKCSRKLMCAIFTILAVVLIIIVIVIIIVVVELKKK